MTAALTASTYSADPFVKSFGADALKLALTHKYGSRYVEYRKAWERSEHFELQPFPLNLVLDLIDLCNLACPQCLRAVDLIKNYDGLLGTKNKLTLDQIEGLLKEGREHGLPSVNIGGSGECTVHPHFVKICEAVMANDVMELRVISNGLRMKDKVGDALIDLGVHVVSISIDAFSAKTFGITRGNADRYQLVVDNVLHLAEAKRRRGAEFPFVRVSFVEQDSNKHETDDFVAFWSQHVDYIDVQTYHDFRAQEFNSEFDCSEPFRRLTVWADGHVGPCCGFPGIVYDVGNVKQSSIADIWNSPEINRIRQMMINRNYEKPCLQCQGARKAV